MRLFVLLLGFLTISCGADNQDGAAAAEDLRFALVIADAAELPGCDEGAQGRLVYVKAEATFKYCDAGAWVPIDLRGPKGDAAPAATPPAAPNGKLRKGMTKDEAQAVLGAPQSVNTYDTITVWNYAGAMCGILSCQLEFSTSDGLLKTVSSVKPEYIDLTTF